MVDLRSRGVVACRWTPGLTLGLSSLIASLLCAACERGSRESIELKTSALLGDPIESIQQVQGVAPVTVNRDPSPPDGGPTNGASFTIGLFDEDAASCHPLPNRTPTRAVCSIMGDIDPAHRGVVGGPSPIPNFEDISVVSVVVNVGTSASLSWDWNYNTYNEDPINAFWVDILDQSGATTSVIPRVSAPLNWGFALWVRWIGFDPVLGGNIPWTPGLQTAKVDLGPWAGQKIEVRFSLQNNFDGTYYNRDCEAHCPASYPPGVCESSCFPFNGVWDLPTAKAYVSNLRVDFCSVESVDFREIDSPLDNNPGLGGGLRIFPDKHAPDDTTDRSLVCVVAKMNNPDCPLTVRLLDVDDPSSDAAPVDSKGSASDDNDPRGISGLTSATGCPQMEKSGADGVATAALRVSKFPGDNFVVVAGVNVNEVGGVTTSGSAVNDAGGGLLPTTRLKKTLMLTVWRRLHIERDSMGIVTGNHESGLIRSVGPDPQVPGSVRLRVDTALDLFRFENGRLVINGQSFVVDRNTVNSIFIDGAVADLLPLRGLPFTVYDDDDFNRNDGRNLRGDEGEDVPMPSDRLVGDSGLAEFNVLAPAYVQPIYDLGPNDQVTFALNLDNYDEGTIQDVFAPDRESDSDDGPDFWAVYLLGAYQGTVSTSRDPDVDTATMGVVDTVGGTGALIFLETQTDAGETVLRNQATTVAHEIGHLLCLKHGEGGLMGGKDGVVASLEFMPQSLAKIRQANRWYDVCELGPNAN
jgi:hypothetical protein